MEDVAREVVRQLRVQDGDLDVWVRWHWCSSNYKIQPTVRDGKLRWLWCGMENENLYTLVLEDVDELMSFLHAEFELETGGKLGRPPTCLIVGTCFNGKFRKECRLFSYSLHHDHGAGDRLKQFLLRCPKIAMCKKQEVSVDQ